MKSTIFLKSGNSIKNMRRKSTQVDYFGLGKKKSIPMKRNSVNWINTTNSNKKFNLNKGQSWLGGNTLGRVNKPGSFKLSTKPVTFFQEDRPHKKLSPYGDYDMDGSPNKWDCDPKNPMKDGLFNKILAQGAKLVGRRDVYERRMAREKPKDSSSIKQRIESAQSEKTNSLRNQVRSKIYSDNEKKQQNHIKNRIILEESKRLRKQNFDAQPPIDKLRAYEQRSANRIKNYTSGVARAVAYRPSTQSTGQQKMITKRVVRALSTVVPQGTVRDPYPTKNRGLKGESGGRGRPAGPSGKYIIPGIGPVGVFQYRAWLTQQRKLKSVTGQDIRQQMQQQVPQQTVPQSSYQNQTQNQSQYSEQAAPQQYQQQQYQTPQYQAQPSQPVDDNILHAPSIGRGELRKPVAINTNAQVRMMDVASRLGPRPIGNPQGDQYTDIDPVSGQPIYRKRLSEKWATGEAY